MSDEPRWSASPLYAFGQLERALRQVAAAGDGPALDRARRKLGQWQAVVAGLGGGELAVGSRTPVADTPAWVTLEVTHGGFATGRYLAEAPLREDEVARLHALPDGAPGTTDRERLNLWYLSDAGQAELLAALPGERYRVDVPEEAALVVVAWLLDAGHHEAALDLVAALRPLMHRLRLTPALRSVPRPAGAMVRRESVGSVRRALRERQVPSQIATMRANLSMAPLYDRLVALWCDTVEGDPPTLSGEPPEGGDDAPGQGSIRLKVVGGWPCRVWPADWAERRSRWLADYGRAVLEHPSDDSRRQTRSNFTRLRRALQACASDSSALSGREVGWIRRALANTLTRHGAPGSPARTALRASQAVTAALPTHATLARVVAARLDRYPADGGIPATDALVAEVVSDDIGDLPHGHPIPSYLVGTALRALEAPVDELVARGVIGSGEVLAEILPQVTSQLVAANIDDPDLAAVYAQTYAAFRRRRSLLLLNLEAQVRLEELPWIAALEPLRTHRPDAATRSREALRQAVLLAVTAFPQAILPNPLVRELGALARQAGVTMPLLEEVAADIFMGTFTDKWRRAAAIASEVLAGSLYARYYDLPEPDVRADVAGRGRRHRPTFRWGKRTAEDFAAVCAARAYEAQTAPAPGYVATNGTVLEQSQILTTHNLAVLVGALHLRDRIRDLSADLASRTFDWIVRRLTQRAPHRHAELQMVKNAAYAWRQAIFYLSFADHQAQTAAVARLGDRVDAAGLTTRFGPAVDGLRHVAAGGRFTPAGTINGHPGRRFLGWTTGPHWYLDEPAPRTTPIDPA